MTSYSGNGCAAVDATTSTLVNQLSFILPMIADLGAVATPRTVTLASGSGGGTVDLTQFSTAALEAIFVANPLVFSPADQTTALAILASVGMLGA